MKPDFSGPDGGINKAQRCKNRGRSTWKKTQINRCNIFIISDYSKSETVMGEEKTKKKYKKKS